MNKYSMGQEFSFTFAMADDTANPTYSVYANEIRITTGECVERDTEFLKGFYVAKGAISSDLGYLPGGQYDVFATGETESKLIGSFEVSGSMARIMDVVDVNVVSVATGAIGPWAMATGAIGAAAFATGAIGAVVFATGAISDSAISGSVVDKIMDEEVESALATTATVRLALKASVAQGFGKWTLEGTLLTLFGPDGNTVYRQFELDSATNPKMRSPL